MICVFRKAGNEMPTSIVQLPAELGLYFGQVFPKKKLGAGSLKGWSLIYEDKHDIE